MLPKKQMGSRKLRQNKPLATFPRLKSSFEQQAASLFGAVQLIQQRGYFDGEVVALVAKAAEAPQFIQSPLRCFAHPFPKLVALVENARVAPIRSECALEGLSCLRRIVMRVEVCDPKIPPGGGETWIEAGA